MSQKTILQHSITYETAEAAIRSAVKFARERQIALSFVVVDPGGYLVAAARMDGAAFITIDVARGKAYASAATGGQSGAVLAGRYNDNPMVWANLSAMGHGAPLLPARGALPIFVEGKFIGAMGASGAPSEVDEAAVAHAIQSIGGTFS